SFWRIRMARGHGAGKGRTRAISKQSGSSRVRSGTAQSGKQEGRQADSARQANAAGDGTLRRGTRPAVARGPEKSPGSAEKVWHKLAPYSIPVLEDQTNMYGLMQALIFEARKTGLTMQEVTRE